MVAAPGIACSYAVIGEQGGALRVIYRKVLLDGMWEEIVVLQRMMTQHFSNI